jgi:hypothetical protein
MQPRTKLENIIYRSLSFQKKTSCLVESPEIFHVVIEYIILIIEIIVGIFVAGIVIITLVNLFRSLLSKLRKRQQQVHIRQIVTRMLRGGRPDLATAEILARSEAPTLLIVGEKSVNQSIIKRT